MSDLEVVTSSERHDLDEQADDAFRPGWPEFIFHDTRISGLPGKAAEHFPRFNVMLLDDGNVVAGGWGVPLRWDGNTAALPEDGYDGALISALAGHEAGWPGRC